MAALDPSPGLASVEAMKSLTHLLATTLLLTPLFSQAAPQEDEWIELFNGKDLSGWKGYQMDGPPEAGWTVEDGILHCNGSKERVDLITVDEYENFELWLEWKTEPSGNSGILLLGDEEPAKMWNHAPEIQIFDAADKEIGLEHQAGAIYGLYPANASAIKPVGEWNDMRIQVKNRVITVTLNGEQICTATIGSDDWNAKVAASKFSKYEKFATNTKGHIGLQNHGQQVWFKTVKLKKL